MVEGTKFLVDCVFGAGYPKLVPTNELVPIACIKGQSRVLLFPHPKRGIHLSEVMQQVTQYRRSLLGFRSIARRALQRRRTSRSTATSAAPPARQPSVLGTLRGGSGTGDTPQGRVFLWEMDWVLRSLSEIDKVLMGVSHAGVLCHHRVVSHNHAASFACGCSLIFG